ncbi:MAG TPA: pyridoxal phosphate-dependent aminotransferase [Sediminispirochaeta sp.]|nr:pyridoxal phosphate-dependent aminotransferase [Sediminispirochaeta sp.]
MQTSRLEVSDRSKLLKESPIRKLVPFADAARRAGKTVYQLNIGQPDIPTIPAMRKAYENAPEVLAYGPSQGLDELINKFHGYYRNKGIEVNKEDVFITTGGSEAIIFALMAIGSAGDEVIVPEPYYANYNGFAAMVGLRIVPVSTTLENNFHLPDIEDFAAKIGPRTKAILFSNPGNPTGAVFSKEKLQALADLARKKDLYLISDEVYREFTYGEREAVSVLQLEGVEEHALMVDSVSKRFSACGARIGTLVSRNHRVLDLVMRFAQARLCPPTLDQVAAAAALEDPEEYLDQVRREYKQRRDHFVKGLSDIEGVRVSSPEGAFYLIAELPVDDSEAFAEWLLSDFDLDGETVMVAPAAGFYSSPGAGRRQIRLAYVLERNKLARSVEILREALKVYPGRE